ncbi:MAG: hypothetical protein ACKV1O_03760 [Saprospiraceae bacterium]
MPVQATHEVIPAARALSDSAYGLAYQREAIYLFIENGNNFYEALRSLELSPDNLLSKTEIALLQLSSRSLNFLKDTIAHQQIFTELLPIINKILPNLDSLINTAIVALDPRIWEAVQAIDRGEKRGVNFESLEEASRFFGFEWTQEEEEPSLAD